MSPFLSAQDDAWFRLGRLNVTSTMAVVLLGAASLLLWAFLPGVPAALLYAPQLALGGEVWRLFTWPLADTISLWSVINLALLWYFGRDLEAGIGKRKMAWLYGGIWLAMTLSTTVVGLLLPGAAAAGLQLVEFAVLLLWIAESPNRQFFFGIPAWVFGVVLVAIQVLQYIGYRAWPVLLNLVVSLALVAVFARGVGLLSAYPWIPGGKRARSPRAAASRPTASRPTAPAPSRVRAERRRVTDEERIDQLLDKISAHGIHSLTKAERAELEKLRQRRR